MPLQKCNGISANLVSRILFLNYHLSAFDITVEM